MYAFPNLRFWWSFGYLAVPYTLKHNAPLKSSVCLHKSYIKEIKYTKYQVNFILYQS